MHLKGKETTSDGNWEGGGYRSFSTGRQTGKRETD